MVKNYNKHSGYVEVFIYGETKWQSLVRAMVKVATQFSAINGREYVIEQTHRHIGHITSKTHRVRAYKRFGKWLRETEV